MAVQENPDDLRIGIDIGGTFTDFVVLNPRNHHIQTFKILSTPENPAEAVLTGLNQLSAFENVTNIVHGSTVATNALLERKGARTALVTTQGFRDILHIGRQNRPELYSLAVKLPAPLVPPELRFEVAERVTAEGEILVNLTEEAVANVVAQIQQARVESIAVCLLFSFLRPEHETLLSKTLRNLGYFVSPSIEVLPEFREFERMSTTTVNAYVSPVLDRYLSNLKSALDSHEKLQTNQNSYKQPHIRIMQSNGGAIHLDEARKNGVHCILSGPAGGVIGAQFVAEKALAERPLRLITFDMGGTSTDVSLIDGAPQLTTESTISGVPIRVPVLDIHTIGAGGGSIARIDAGGLLQVGPESAGANPGPACYGLMDPKKQSTQFYATVTDANLVLGRLIAEEFLDGQMPLKPQLARKAIDRIAKSLNLDTISTAMGIIEITNAHMERALRVISVERGHDPREFTLLSFGGAGGLHAVDLACRLGIPRVLFPPYASTLSALGMLAAPVIKDYSRTVMLPGTAPSDTIYKMFIPLVNQAMAEMAFEGQIESEVDVALSLDMRYKGQSYELSVTWDGIKVDYPEWFHKVHGQTYGYSNPGSEVEIVNVRVRATGRRPGMEIFEKPGSMLGSSISRSLKTRQIYLKSAEGAAKPVKAPVYQWEQLYPGDEVSGPALITRKDTTILLDEHSHGKLDRMTNLIVTIN